MKKSITLVLALMVALTAIFSLSVLAFADGSDAPAEPTTAAATTAAPAADTADTRPTSIRDIIPTTAATTAADTTKSAADSGDSILNKLTTTTKLPDQTKEDTDAVVTGPSAVVDDPTEATKAASGDETKAPAKVVSSIPNTGSSMAVPAIAVLALVAGTVAVVKTKKEF